MTHAFTLTWYPSSLEEDDTDELPPYVMKTGDDFDELVEFAKERIEDPRNTFKNYQKVIIMDNGSGEKEVHFKAAFYQNQDTGDWYFGTYAIIKRT